MATPGCPVLELEHVSKDYAGPGEVVHALRGASLSVHERELVALYGPSGSGKSTLLLLAAGLLRADAGSVRFDGRELSRMSRSEALSYRRVHLGFVFQSFNLAAGLSAEENVAIALLTRGVDRRQALARARALLEHVGLGPRLRHSPEQLAGGEQQRVAIARALVGEPRLILADEPTGNLDGEAGRAVLELLGSLPRARGAAVVLVTHDARAASVADRVLELMDGHVAESRAGVEAELA
ncbi:MAG: ABC transporter ATP-binding protein [Solirubrobacteraceae bacterium]